jgi:hypothetical protein
MALRHGLAQLRHSARDGIKVWADAAKQAIIDPRAWALDGTAFQSAAAAQGDDVVPGVGTTVPFTKALLRAIGVCCDAFGTMQAWR